MPSFEEEAFARAQQMHRRVPPDHSSNSQTGQRQNNREIPRKTDPKPVQEPSGKAREKSEAKAVSSMNYSHSGETPLNTLFENNEQSLILLLLVLLMEDNAEPTLLLALVYLLL